MTDLDLANLFPLSTVKRRDINNLPPGTGRKPDADDKPLSTRWRAILSLELRGFDKVDIAAKLGLTPYAISAATRDPRYIKEREELLGNADAAFLELKPLAIAALSNGLASTDENTALRASDQFFRVSGFGTYGKGASDDTAVTAESVARALVQQAIQVNVTVNTGEQREVVEAPDSADNY